MEQIKWICAAVGGFFSYIFGGLDQLLTILLVFIVIDFISGFVKAWVKKEFSSSVFYIGGLKKVGILLLVAVAAQLDGLFSDGNAVLRVTVITYYIANEGFSILENWGALGLPLPKALKNALVKLNDKAGESEGKDNESK